MNSNADDQEESKNMLSGIRPTFRNLPCEEIVEDQKL